MDEEQKFSDSGELITSTPIIDPRQQGTWNHYMATVIAGSPNARAAAVKAGYSENYAEHITVQKWFIDRKNKLKRSDMLSLAEKNLKDVLKLPYTKKRMEKKVEVLEIDTDVLRIIIDVSKATVKALGKDEGWSERSEVTGKGGDPIVFMPAELLDKHKLIDNKK